MEDKDLYKQIKSIKRLTKNLDNQISSLIVEKNQIIESIKKLDINLQNLTKEIENEKTLSKQFLNFEFEIFFKVSKQKIEKLLKEKNENKLKLNILIERLHEKYQEQKKYENLLEKFQKQADHTQNLNEQKNLDEISQHMFNVDKNGFN